MSYLTQWRLAYDDEFVSRSRAALTQQAEVFKDDDRADIAALATSLLTAANPQESLTFVGLLAAAPGFGDTVDQGDGTVNSSLIADADILAAVQAEWPTVAALFYGADGGPVL
jgi:hypothetical protein